MSELKACPFCGASGSDLSVVEITDDYTMFTVYCANCYTQGPLCDEETDAKLAWNEREVMDTVALFSSPYDPRASTVSAAFKRMQKQLKALTKHLVYQDNGKGYRKNLDPGAPWPPEGHPMKS
jgi:Lar family restriction alleviation protein